MQVKQLDHLNLTVNNLEETADWYKRVFGFEWVERGTYRGKPWGVIKAGDAMLCIYERPEFKFEDPEARVARTVHGINHFALRITDKKAWEDTIKREKVEVGMTWRYPNSDSWYVYDPTGYEIEVACWDGDTISFEDSKASVA